MTGRTLGFSVALITMLLAARAHAAAKTWIGSDGDSYSTAANWSPSGTPGTADSILFAVGRGRLDLRHQFRHECQPSRS